MTNDLGPKATHGTQLFTDTLDYNRMSDGLTEALMVVKTLLMECLVAVLTQDHLYGEVTLLLLIVEQTCLIPSLKRAAV